jgi:hypothetical protein
VQVERKAEAEGNANGWCVLLQAPVSPNFAIRSVVPVDHPESEKSFDGLSALACSLLDAAD